MLACCGCGFLVVFFVVVVGSGGVLVVGLLVSSCSCSVLLEGLPGVGRKCRKWLDRRAPFRVALSSISFVLYRKGT